MKYNSKITAQLYIFFENALQEDIGSGDYTTLACIDNTLQGKAILKTKQSCIVAGMEIAKMFLKWYIKNSKVKVLVNDGIYAKKNTILLEVHGPIQKLLSIERTLLNIVQRMSGIATLTQAFVKKIHKYDVQLLDSRKTIPNFRLCEKEAVKIGGGANHRMGLYDAIMIKDNHIDCIGGVEQALQKIDIYLKSKKLNMPIIIEARNLKEVQNTLKSKIKISRILLDNFTCKDILKAKKLTQNKIPLEVSGGIDLKNIHRYAKTKVDYISTGAITHQAQSIDMNFKIVVNNK